MPRAHHLSMVCLLYPLTSCFFFFFSFSSHSHRLIFRHSDAFVSLHHFPLTLSLSLFFIHSLTQELAYTLFVTATGSPLNVFVAKARRVHHYTITFLLIFAMYTSNYIVSLYTLHYMPRRHFRSSP